MNKKIITIAEIVFALVFVILLAVFMATINSKGNQANTQLVDTLDSTTGNNISKYATMDSVKGTVVVNAVENYTTLSSDTKITVAVQTSANSADKDTWVLYGYDLKGEQHPGYSADSTSNNYINPSANFGVHLIENSNDVIVGIAFKQGVKSSEMNNLTIDGIITDSSKNKA